MLASLTGLLLTLGGDQPAVVFDPPLDPAIFDWDGTTLRVRPEFLPFELSFPEPLPPYSSNQKVIFNEFVEVQTSVRGVDFSSGLPKREGQISIWADFEDFDKDGIIDSWEDDDLAENGNFVSPGTIYLLGRIESDVSELLLIAKPIGSSPSGEDSDDRITELEEKVQALEQAIESCQCASDLDGDGSVGFTDLVELISVWGPCSA